MFSFPSPRSFFENVPLHKAEGRELREGEELQNTLIQFRPQPTQDMLFACVFSHWQREGEDDLLSFALITDEPPPEVAAAGHDRCVIAVKRENLATWLSPDKGDLDAQQAILSARGPRIQCTACATRWGNSASNESNVSSRVCLPAFCGASMAGGRQVLRRLAGRRAGR